MDGVRTNACCADPTEYELIKVVFDFDAHYVVAGCVDPALGLQGADPAAWLDAEGDGLELHLDSLDWACLAEGSACEASNPFAGWSLHGISIAVWNYGRTRPATPMPRR